MNPLLIAAFSEKPATPIEFSMSSANISRVVSNGLTCYAMHEWRSDGIEYSNASGLSSTVNQSRGAYLTGDSASNYYIERTIDFGSLNVDEIGAVRVQLNATYRTGIQFSGGGSGGGLKTTTVTFSIYDAPSGGTLMDQSTVVFTAQEESI